METEIAYPQDKEENEYRYISPTWLNEIAKGLTKGAEKHPGETWRTIPAKEHAWRAVRHLVMYLCGDRSELHLINASMRVMMAFATSRNETGESERVYRSNVGAKDINGKEICIGDKVKMHDYFVGTVGANVWGTYTKKDNGRLLYWSNYIDDTEKEIEVIGRDEQ